MSHTGAVRRWLIGALVGLLLAASPASAQDPGVQVDPDSPSGREYDIPLASARRDAQPGVDRSAPATSAETPLFGEGITTKDSSSSAPAKGGSRQPRPRGKRPAKAPAPSRTVEPAPAAVRIAAANPGAPGGGAGTTALFVLGGVLVLGAGVGAGVLVKRASRS